VPACEYDRMKRVAPGDPDQSFLLVKLEAPFKGPGTHEIAFTPAPDWSPTACNVPSSDGQPGFGLRMPETGTFQLEPEKIAKLRSWIRAGALGPD
jgi:hypothetical protein